ncbi:MAG: DUF177 domain-containing protein [Candidatus Omnitrophica bacterium]|nr:DUF177 domain-containing protein [Candidatus Omnitrophota bacterium]
MKIFVNEILPEGMDLEEKMGPSVLDLETDQIHFTDGLDIKAHIEKDKDIVTVDCSAKGVEKRTCSRCLSEFSASIDKRMNFIFQLEGERTIELDDKIKDEVILDHPIRMLCKPDCKGLCALCGKNLSSALCKCKE